METIITALINNPVLFGLAFLVNILVSIFKDITEGICIGKGEDPAKGIPAVIFKNILLLMVIAFSYTGTFWLCKMEYITPIDNSRFTTSIVVAVMSIIFYNIGVKDLLVWIKEKLNIKKTTQSETLNNDGGNR